MKQLKIFIELTRLDKPIGFMLLFWPCTWSLAFAYNIEKDLNKFLIFLLLFFLGSVLMLYLGDLNTARIIFAGCCVCMIISIFLFLQEIRLSNQALKYHLSDMDSMKKDL